MNHLNADDQARIDAASVWRLRMRDDPALEQSPEFAAWVGQPGNLEAFAAVQQGWSAVDDVATSPELLDLRRRVLTNVRRRGAARWRMPWVARAAAVLAALAVGAALYIFMPRADIYVTDIGERRTVALVDGSRLSLDSDSRVEVRYTDAVRELDLIQGRALFDVAHDTTRPFTVTAANETVVAVGTSFSVEKLGARVLVTLIEGEIVVKRADPTLQGGEVKKTVSMTAGQQLIAVKDVVADVKPADVQIAKAWEAGQLLFRNEALADAAARVNRYTEHPVVIDPAVADIRITGVFNAGDVTAFVSGVTGYFPVQATTTKDNRILLQPRR